jgi:4-amino-4-deoxy-L-arabinose transferase-like glycosyltransferase
MRPPAKFEGNRYSIIGTAVVIGSLIPLAQYSFRKFDDNNYASWDWIFRIVNPGNYALALISGILLVAIAFSAFRFTLPSRLRNTALFSVCFIAAAVLWMTPEANIDTSRYFMQAKHLELYGINYFLSEWGKGIPAWTDLPAVPFFHGLLFTVFGESRLPVQIFTTLLFAMTAVLTSLIGKTLWDEDTGFYAGALLLGMPYLLSQTPLMLVDVPTMFFLMLSIHLFMHVVEAGGLWRVAAAACSVFLTVCCKYSTWPMLSVLPLIAIVFWVKSDGPFRLQIMRRSISTFLATFLLVGVAGALKYDVVSSQLNLLMNFQRAGLERWGESFASTFLFQIHPVVTLAAIASIIVAVKKRDLKYPIAAWLPLLIIIFQIKRIRYTLPVFPLVSLMAAYGLAVFRDHDFRKLVVACIVTTSLTVSFFAYMPYFNHSSAVNLEQAGNFLNTLDIDAVEVFTAPQHDYPVNPAVAVPILDLFTRKTIVYSYRPGTSSPDEDVRLSRFRFSWEYQNPGYYTATTKGRLAKRAVVLISGRQRDEVPAEAADSLSGLHSSMSYTTTNPLFRYQTLVRIYW